MSLCGPCTSVFGEKTLVAGTIYNHHPSWTSFVAAADEKCDVCGRVFDINLAFEASFQRSQGLIDIETQKELDEISNILYTRCPKLPFLPSDVGNDFVKPINGESTSSASTWDLVLS